MKTIILLMILIGCGVSSCRKEYTCQCTIVSRGQIRDGRTFTVKANEDNAAEILCAQGAAWGESCALSY